MSDKKVEQWMRDAAAEIRQLCLQQGGYLNAELSAKIIASHAPVAPVDEEAERRKFEKWALAELYEGIAEAKAPAEGAWGYSDDDVDNAWLGWLARARSAHKLPQTEGHELAGKSEEGAESQRIGNPQSTSGVSAPALSRVDEAEDLAMLVRRYRKIIDQASACLRGEGLARARSAPAASKESRMRCECEDGNCICGAFASLDCEAKGAPATPAPEGKQDEQS